MSYSFSFWRFSFVDLECYPSWRYIFPLLFSLLARQSFSAIPLERVIEKEYGKDVTTKK